MNGTVVAGTAAAGKFIVNSNTDLDKFYTHLGISKFIYY